MTEAIYPVSGEWAEGALISNERYLDMHRRSVTDPDGFWREEAQRIDWIRPFSVVKQTSFDEADFGISWFTDGTLNLSANCLDRHLAERGDAVAILWEPDDPKNPERRITYRELHEQVCKFANLLKARGVRKGERVTIYLPMVPEAAVAMLACARIGAIHSIVFAGFSPDALAGRIIDCDSSIVLTADEGLRGGKKVPLKANVDEALAQCHGVDTVIVLEHTGAGVPMVDGRDIDWASSVADMPAECAPEEMNAEDPLFILYTSGSTGKPKGVLHTTGGYSVWASMTHEYVFDYRPGQIYWCAADIGWVTGHSYVVYGPLMNGATTVRFEGVPNFPDASRFWQVVDKFDVEIFYGAPTALRALMREGDEWVKKTSRKSLRLLGSVGEPIKPEDWEWYHKVVGGGRCPIVDTWWQTETGGVMITPLPGATALKPGSAT
ncbi:MAG: acetate--CoA ligase, partial [Novosphingobium sp.]